MQGFGTGPKGKGSLELIEEATHLVRRAPLSALASYYVGALPFMLGALFFWGDMSRSPFAGQHLAEAALGLAGLFIWMKFWQARFARQLRLEISGADNGANSSQSSDSGVLTHLGRSLLTQTALQPTGLFLVTAASILTLPFAWVYAFYQNVTVLGELETGEEDSRLKKAIRLARLWPRQNHLVLAILSGFGLFVFLNLSTVCYLLPDLVKTLFGVESVFSRSGASLLNSTFFATMFGLTYLCVDPLVKAVYVLRCFYGESLESGEDLKAELKQFSGAARVLVGLALLLTAAASSFGAPPAASAQPDLSASGTHSILEESGSGQVSPSELDRAIQQVIQERKYAWRAPREKILEPDDNSQGILGRFFQRVQKLINKWFSGVGSWLDKWLRKLFQSRRHPVPTSSGYGWMVFLQLLLYGLIAAAVAGLGVLAYRVWRDRRQPPAAVTSQPMSSAPDLNDLNLGPEQLPEDGWTKLARELLGRGEWRLALRAFYLAGLAHLAARNLISLARFKSNREYEGELRRRAHSLPELLSRFGESVSMFDSAWYGRRELDSETVLKFAANVERIKISAGT